MKQFALMPALAVLCILLAACGGTAPTPTVEQQALAACEAELNQLQADLTHTLATLADREAKLDQMQEDLAQARAALVAREAELGQIQSDLAQERATPDPMEQRIAEDLLSRSELIPFEGVVGGTPFWYHAEVIAYRASADTGFVYACAEDGHIAGDGLFLYQLQEDDEIGWTALFWRML